MFATLQLNGRTKTLVERNDSSSSRQACSSCRKRKVKCTGEKDGCEPCRSRNLECIYPDLADASQASGNKRTLSELISDASESGRSNGSQKRFVPNSMPLNEYAAYKNWNPSPTDTFDFANLQESEWFDFEPTNYVDIDGYLENLNDAGWFVNPASPLATYETSDTSSPLTSNSNSNKCDCMQQIARSIETLEVEMSRSSLKNIVLLFSQLKETLALGTPMSKCQLCRTDSSVTMMKIILSQKLIASFEHILLLLGRRYIQLSNRPQGYQTPPGYMEMRDKVQRMPPERDEDNELVVLINGFSLSPIDTPCAFTGLIQQQLFLMRHLLGKMRIRVADNGWQTHLALIDAINSRIKNHLDTIFSADHKIFPE